MYLWLKLEYIVLYKLELFCKIFRGVATNTYIRLTKKDYNFLGNENIKSENVTHWETEIQISPEAYCDFYW